jgi:broad specificity phosphatase PhoE
MTGLPIVHCIHHAEFQHSPGAEAGQVIDPELTAKGKLQCEALRASRLVNPSRICLVAASPLMRCLQTAFLGFRPSLHGDSCQPLIMALPDAQEVFDYPHNAGSEMPLLAEKCLAGKLPVDLTAVEEGWTRKDAGTRYFPSRSALEARARDCRRELLELARNLMDEGVEGPEIVLVTHGGFVHFLTEDWEAADLYGGTGWRDAEIRSYLFQMNWWDPEDVRLVETAESLKSRGKVPAGFSRTRNESSFQLAMNGWEKQGLPNPIKLNEAPGT